MALLNSEPGIEDRLYRMEEALAHAGPPGVAVLEVGLRIVDRVRRLTFYYEEGLSAIDTFRRYRETPVGPREFLLSKDYLDRGAAPGRQQSLWPLVLDAYEELNSGKYDSGVLTGAIGTAKSTIAIHTLAYQTYLLGVMRSPHKEFDLIDTDEIVMVIQSVSKTLVETGDFQRFKNLIDTAPWFKRYFPRNLELSSECRFPRNVIVRPLSSSDTAALGQNVIGGLLEEANFMAIVEDSKQSKDSTVYDQAEELYRAISRRRESRFLRPGKHGKLPGILCMVSSKQYPGEFTERVIEHAAAEKVRTGRSFTYVYDKRRWDIKPEDYKDSTWFRVFTGDLTRRPRILDPGEEVDDGDEHLVLDVPEDHRRPFEEDILKALRDVGGVATMAINPFMPQTDKVAKVFGRSQSVLTAEWCDFKTHGVGIDKSKFVNPEEPRWLHVDLGLTKDSAGMACGRVDEFVEIERTIKDEVETMPLVVFDFLLEVRPPKGGEIDFGMIRSLVYALREEGLNIRWVTLDSYQSVDFIQQVRQRGFKGGMQSMDETDLPYQFLKTAIVDGRVHAPKHAKAQKELPALEYDSKKMKVDHPPHGSKDVADCMASVVYGLTRRLEVWVRHKVRTRLPKRLITQITQIKSNVDAGADDETGTRQQGAPEHRRGIPVRSRRNGANSW